MGDVVARNSEQPTVQAALPHNQSTGSRSSTAPIRAAEYLECGTLRARVAGVGIGDLREIAFSSSQNCCFSFRSTTSRTLLQWIHHNLTFTQQCSHNGIVEWQHAGMNTRLLHLYRNDTEFSNCVPSISHPGEDGGLQPRPRLCFAIIVESPSGPRVRTDRGPHPEFVGS